MYEDRHTIERIGSILRTLDENRRPGRRAFTGTVRMKPIGYNERDTIHEDCSNWQTLEEGALWGGKDAHYNFRFSVQVPEEMEGLPVVLSVTTGANDIWNTDNPQLICYVNNEAVTAMDMNHNEVILTDHGARGETFEIGLYAYSNQPKTNFLNISLAAKDNVVEDLYYDVRVPLETAKELPEDDTARMEIVTALDHAVNLLELWEVERVGEFTGINETDAFHRSAKEASHYLHRSLYGHGMRGETVASVGHTHIDVAWKWPVRQTREKAIRSYSSVLYLMDRYPEYRFMASSPQTYAFVKEDAPALYEKIRGRVREGRFEPEGVMWLESETNLTSAESLIRQIYYGQKFFLEEFGKKTDVLWLPDVFGYSGALPQILRRSGIHSFMTTKIAWNDTNRFPNDLFNWRGIDGSGVMVYFITTCDYQSAKRANATRDILQYTYNGRQNPSQILGTVEAFQNRNLTDELLTCYGYGDGGGGPTADMLEVSRRMEEGIPGLPRVKQSGAAEFFRRLHKKIDRRIDVPEWNGELYFEYHRGTLTSMAENKRNNRKCEIAAQDAEFLSALAANYEDLPYPADELEKDWKILLLDQFHDILPGSAIEEVYDQTAKDYTEVLDSLEGLQAAAKKALFPQGETNCLYVINTGDSEQSGLVRLSAETAQFFRDNADSKAPIANHLQEEENGVWLFASGIPAKGYRRIYPEYAGNTIEPDALSIQKNGEKIRIQTPYYEAVVKDGEITSLIDRGNGRQLRAKGADPLNHLLLFEDRPWEYDNWNIDAGYEEKQRPFGGVTSCRIGKTGPLFVSVITERSFQHSLLRQEMIFYRDNRRIDFVTDMDWYDHQILVKAAFATDLLTDHVTAEIQDGVITRPNHRNTSWDQAMFECCAHRFVDLSEADYGVAILNDGRYGYDALDGTLRLTLLKSGIFPNENADCGAHHFIYSLLPHEGDYRKGRVTEEADLLNKPLTALVGSYRGERYSAAYVDAPGVYLDTVKRAEDGNGLILRFYEGHGATREVHADVAHLHPESAVECTPTEEKIRGAKNVLEKGQRLSFTIRPFEIRTFRLGCTKF